MVRYGSARTLIHHKAQRGMAWLGEARLGRDSDTTQGRARLGRARHGEARRGKAGQGSDTTNHRSTAAGPLAADPRCE